jgi:hypothetical protein
MSWYGFWTAILSSSRPKRLPLTTHHRGNDMDINTLRMPRIALKIPRLQGHVSSILTFGTNDLRDFEVFL